MGKRKTSGSGTKRTKEPKELRTLRATVDKLETKLAKAQRKADKWKAEARAERARSAKLETRLNRPRADVPVDHAQPGRPDPGFDGSPDASWTVVRLRSAARKRGLVGASRMTKPQLLQALAG